MSAAPRLLTAALLTAAWSGAAWLTVLVVAPGAFAVLGSRTLAGAMVGHVLPPIFLSGVGVGLVVLLLARAQGAARGAGEPFVPPVVDVRRHLLGATAAAAVLVLACALAQFIIQPRIARLRDVIGGPIDALAHDDPRRVAFGMLHGYSVAGLGVAMLAAGLTLVFLLLAMRTHR